MLKTPSNYAHQLAASFVTRDAARESFLKAWKAGDFPGVYVEWVLSVLDAIDGAFAERDRQITAEADFEAEVEAEADCDDRLYRQGWSQDDTMDGRGRPLRPLVNEGGEPYWM